MIVSAIDPRTFALSSQGSPVAIRVTGESDGQFNGSDRIEFFGQKFRGTTLEEKYTDERVYWLDIGGTAGPRIADAAAAPQNNLTPPTDFATTVRSEPNMWYWNLESTARGDDTWFEDRFRNITTTTTRSYSDATPDPVASSGATLRVEMLGRKALSPNVNPNHRVTVAIGSTALADASWSTYNRMLITAAVPAGTVSTSATAVTIGVQMTSTNTLEDMYFNYWELDYRRLFRAYGDALNFKAETASTTEYSISNFSSNDVAVWNLTAPAQPVRLTGASVEAVSGAYTVRFRVTPAVGNRYWLQTESSFAAPASISIRAGTGLRVPAGGADTVIVTPSAFRPAAETLATWHRAHGRRAVVADLQDVYDEFNDGIRHPVAVRQMMTWAAANWTAPAPAYLVLMGDGNFNMKGFNTALYTNTSDPIPPYLALVDPWVGEIPSDGLFGDITGDDVPDVAVGRIPVNTLAEANTVVNKIVTYDETYRTQAWQRRTIFVAGPKDPLAGDFPVISDEIIQNHLASDLAAQRIYNTITPLPEGTTSYTQFLIDTINSGALMVQWAGHGNINVWSGIWGTSNTSSLTNAVMLPVVMTFNCLDGYYISAVNGSDSVAETTLRHPTGGSIAAISPSGDGVVSDQTPFRQTLMDTLFQTGVRELGQALLVTKQNYVASHGLNYLVYQMNFFGDPALRLPPGPDDLPQAPVVTATRSGSGTPLSSVSLSWPAVTTTQRGAATTVTTYGIWRSTQPYFDPDATNCNCTPVTQTTNLSYSDTAVATVGDVNTNTFYVVRAKNSVGWSPVLRRTGEFDFALQPGS